MFKLTFWCVVSDTEGAEAKCEEGVQKAVAADPNNPEAHQLHASFLLSKDKKDVRAVFFSVNTSATFLIQTYQGFSCICIYGVKDGKISMSRFKTHKRLKEHFLIR